MTSDEATAIIKILLMADGGCPTCAANLVENFQFQFPEHKELAMCLYTDEFGHGLLE